MAHSPPFRVALVGNWSRNEFLPIKSAISTLTEVALFYDFSGINQKCYDLLFLLESYSGEYQEKTLWEYRKQAPLCRMILIAGALAEGEKRTGCVPDGVFRYYTWQLQSLLQELQLFLCSRKTFWFGSLTQTPDDIGLQQLDTFRNILRSVSVWTKRASIVCADIDFAAFLEDLCRAEHYRIVTENDSPELVILDDTGQTMDEILRKIHFQRMRNADVHIFVFWNAPRWDEKRMLYESGADRIFAKPVC